MMPAFFDLETQKTFEEVDRDFTKLGISVAVLRKNKENIIFLENNVDELIEELKSSDIIVGHNHIHFDYTVLRGYGLSDKDFDYIVNKSYDTMAILTKMLGHRISLEHLSKYNLRGAPGKLAPGIKCIEWYKNGEIEKIAELCTDDVMRLARIFKVIITGKSLKILKYWGEPGVDDFAPLQVTMPIPTLLKEFHIAATKC